MKHFLLTTIAAVVVVGCGPQPPDISIHGAAADGNIEAVKQHLAAGTDVNNKGWDDWTPLHFATMHDHKETAELLIAEGADVNAKDNQGRTPVDLAIVEKQNEITELLRKHGGKTSNWLNADESIHIAASAGHIEAVKHHLAAGTDVNAKDKGGGTPLHFATSWDHKETAELLLAKGADVNAKGYAGRTPLDNAIRWKIPEIVNLIRKHGGKTGEELKAEGK